MRKHAYSFLAAAVSAACLAGSAAYALPAQKIKATDLGETSNLTGAAKLEATVVLKLRNADKQEALIQSLHTPGSASYHQFLSSAQFKSQFAPTADTVARVTAHYQAAGFTVKQSSSTMLKISGTAKALQSEFAVQLHSFEAFANGGATRFYAPAGDPQIAPAVADAVEAVVGLDTRPRFHSNLQHSFASKLGGKVKPFASPAATGNIPGEWTVADYAKYYNVNPLYKKGFDGTGSRLAIVTLASFTQSDAYTYWNAVGLKVKKNRIREILVDGGAGPVSDVGGSGETTLDVEQSGGLAPGAKIDVYEAPNTSQGFIDAFASVVDDNLSDTLSASWGIWEYFDLVKSGGGVSDPYNGEFVSSLKAYSEIFIQAALQGQTVYIAAGDAGAYETGAEIPPPSWPPPPKSVVLSVSDPAVQQYVTAIGGTTLPGKQVYRINSTGKLVTVNIKHEQAWSWTYLEPLCDKLGYDPLSCGIFPVGGGGGVSSFVKLPFYQVFIPGILATEPNQTLLDYSQSPPQKITRLPDYYYGRNIPDVSSNADPETGYQLYYTSDTGASEIITYEGGTSFGAPQFNGITALYTQALGHRVGVLNFALYDLVRFGTGYKGSKPPLKDVLDGDNWYYESHGGYDQTTGVGIPDFTNLLNAIK